MNISRTNYSADALYYVLALRKRYLVSGTAPHPTAIQVASNYISILIFKLVSTHQRTSSYCCSLQ